MRHRLVRQVIFAVDFRAAFAASGKSPMRSPAPVCTGKSAFRVVIHKVECHFLRYAAPWAFVGTDPEGISPELPVSTGVHPSLVSPNLLGNPQRKALISLS